jgi:hypothetical protein
MRNRLDFRVSRFYLRENKLSSKIAEGVEKPFVSLSFPDPTGTQSGAHRVNEGCNTCKRSIALSFFQNLRLLRPRKELG